ncbi:hypothetical protein Bca52824_011518 [Brassica carinata]|uniref:DNA-directed RNA polymerase n=1 Tax=Brassica carinata TaxID=52824 RepID=A0A8X7WGH1_BRACI|nr:hypothetical protein Bca52824_011518 [Brassica carinata]
MKMQMSVVHVEHSETTEKGKPKVGGLSDTRLGTIDRKVKCETCMANMAECTGHFGHLELAKPMYHVGFMKTTEHYLPIHRDAPALVDLVTGQEILATGIKVVDLLAPYQRGGKIDSLVVLVVSPFAGVGEELVNAMTCTER